MSAVARRYYDPAPIPDPTSLRRDNLAHLLSCQLICLTQAAADCGWLAIFIPASIGGEARFKVIIDGSGTTIELDTKAEALRRPLVQKLSPYEQEVLSSMVLFLRRLYGTHDTPAANNPVFQRSCPNNDG